MFELFYKLSSNKEGLSNLSRYCFGMEEDGHEERSLEGQTNFQGVAESREDFLKVGRVGHGFRQRVWSRFRERRNNCLHVFTCLSLFYSVTVRCCLAWFWVRKPVIPKRLQNSRALEKMAAINRATLTYRATLIYPGVIYHMISKPITLVIGC